MKSLTEKIAAFRRKLLDASIYNKLLTGYMGLTVCLVALTAMTSFLVMRHSLVEQNKTEFTEKARIIAEILNDDSRGDPVYERMRNIENLTEAQVIYVGPDMMARRIPRIGDRRVEDDEQALQLSAIIDALDVQLVKTIFSGSVACDVREVEFMGGNVIFAGAPVRAPDGSVAGAAILYTPYVEVQSMATEVTLLIVFSSMIAAALSLIVAFGISRWVAKPIQMLTVAARSMASGNYGEQIHFDQKDEIGELGGVLSHMSLKLKKTISDLRDEKSKLMQILSGIGEGIVAADRDGSIVHYNNAALELLDLSEWNEPAERKQVLIDMLHEATESCERAEAVGKNEAGRSIAAKIWPMTSEDGEVLGSVALLRDVSEAERLEQMRKDYVANISHELRTPLTGIRGMVEPLMDGYMDTEEEKMDCDRIIYQETMRLEKLIGEMLDMRRLQAGRAQIELEPMYVEGVLEAACRRMEKRAQESGVQLGLEISGELPEIMGNEDRILQVLIILMDNALSFTQPGGSVTLSAKKQGKNVHISVKDTGAGIDPSDLPYIWERFYKADKSRMRTTGTGLGLAIAKLAVECMGGLITVESELGRGTEFEFSLAVCEE